MVVIDRLSHRGQLSISLDKIELRSTKVARHQALSSLHTRILKLIRRDRSSAGPERRTRGMKLDCFAIRRSADFPPLPQHVCERA